MGELRSAVDALVALDPGRAGARGAERTDRGGHVPAGPARRGVAPRAVATHDRGMVWKRDGARSQKQWLTQRCRLSPGEAAARTETARRLADLPQTTTALAEGRIGAVTRESRPTPRGTSPARPRASWTGWSRRTVSKSTPPACATASMSSPPPGAGQPEGREERAWRHRHLRITRTGDGAVAGEFRLDPVGGETVLTAIAALAALRPRPTAGHPSSAARTRWSHSPVKAWIAATCRRSGKSARTSRSSSTS